MKIQTPPRFWLPLVIAGGFLCGGAVLGKAPLFSAAIAAGSALAGKPLDQAKWAIILAVLFREFLFTAISGLAIFVFYRTLAASLAFHDTYRRHEVFVKGVASYLCSLAACLLGTGLAGVAYGLFSRLVHMDAVLADEIPRLFHKHPHWYSPEPQEFVLYASALALWPALVWLSSGRMNRKNSPAPEGFLYKNHHHILAGSLCFFFLLAGWAFLFFEHPYFPTPVSNYQYYFSGSFLRRPWLLAPYLAGVLAAAVFLVRPAAETRPRWRAAGIGAGAAFVAYVLLCMFFMNLFELPYRAGWHFEPVYYPLLQLGRGAHLWAAGFGSIYGAYAYLLLPVFKIIKLSIFNFSLVMAALIVASYALFGGSLLAVLRNKVLLFFGITTLLFFTYLKPKISGTPCLFDYYFQYHPLRTIFPGLLLFIAVRYFRRRNRAWYFLALLVVPLAILWNPETGLVLLVSWAAYLLFLEYAAGGGWRAWGRRSARHLLRIGLALAGVWAAFYGVHAAVYQKPPDLALLFLIVRDVSHYGYGCIPMPRLHPWILMLLVYFAGLTVSLVSLRHGPVTERTAFIFLVSLLGLGSFTYYLGRSHNANFYFISIYLVLLACALADVLLTEARKAPFPPYTVFVSILLGALAFSSIDLARQVTVLWGRAASGRAALAEYRGINIPWSRRPAGCAAEYQEYRQNIRTNAAFISRHAREGEPVLIIAFEGLPAVYYDQTGTAPALHTSLMNIFRNADYARFRDTVARGGYKVFLEKSMLDFNDRFFFTLTDETKACLRNEYTVIDQNGQFAYYRKRRGLQ